MKKLLILMLIMLGVTVLAQKPKYIYVNAYSKGKPLKTLHVIKLIAKPGSPKPKIKYITKTRLKTIEKPFERVIVKEVIKVDTLKVPVEVTVEKEVIKRIPYEVQVDRIVEKRIEAPLTRNVYLGPNVIVTDRNTVHGLGVNALIKNKYNEIFQIGGGMMMREGLTAPTPFVNLGVFIKLK